MFRFVMGRTGLPEDLIVENGYGYRVAITDFLRQGKGKLAVL